jgi:hypothetical protein
MCAGMQCQDKVYLLNGSKITGKITEVSSDNILMAADGTDTIPREQVLLLEFRNGSVEIINKPQQTVIYNPAKLEGQMKRDDAKNLSFNANLISLNTMALCNADLSGFYERLLPSKRIGIGCMAAYNFNASSGVQNLFISVLSNAKKQYDLGVFANLYGGGFTKKNTFHYGIFFKYMNFTYSKAIEEKVTSGGISSTNIRYTPATGSQLATIFTWGTFTDLSKNIFLKTLFGLGGFNLHGDYKQQYNYFLNKSAGQNPNGQQRSYNRTLLAKIYIGINLGYRF